MSFKNTMKSTGLGTRFSLNWSEIIGLENQLKMIARQIHFIPIDVISKHEHICKKYEVFLESSESPFIFVNDDYARADYMKENGDSSYIVLLRNGRDYLLDLLSPMDKFENVRLKVREEKLKSILED